MGKIGGSPQTPCPPRDLLDVMEMTGASDGEGQQLPGVDESESSTAQKTPTAQLVTTNKICRRTNYRKTIHNKMLFFCPPSPYNSHTRCSWASDSACMGNHRSGSSAFFSSLAVEPCWGVANTWLLTLTQRVCLGAWVVVYHSFLKIKGGIQATRPA